MTTDRTAEGVFSARVSQFRQILTGLLKSDALLTAVENAVGIVIKRDVMSHPLPGSLPREAWPTEGVRKLGIIDTETTGFNAQVHRIIEFSGIVVHWHPDHGLLGFGDEIQMYQDPGAPIPSKITQITGITDDMVRGQKIDEAVVRDTFADCDVIVAHNARFDLEFVAVQMQESGLGDKPWACSVEGVDWLGRYGVTSRSLEVLADRFRWSYPAHSAKGDIRALAYLLSNKEVLSSILESIAKPAYRLIAENSPFEAKDKLKEAGFKWADGAGGELGANVKSWYIDLPDAGSGGDLSEINAALLAAYKRDVTLPVLRIPGHVKFRTDAVRHATRDAYSTREPMSLFEKIAMIDAANGPGL